MEGRREEDGRRARGREERVVVHVQTDHVAIRVVALCKARARGVDEVLKPEDVVQSALA